jgi:predicted TPR repeat methyltransferase
MTLTGTEGYGSEQRRSEEVLRQMIHAKPRNARAMSDLACLLGVTGKNDVNQAIEWARKAIEVAPEKPFGYVAYSLVFRNPQNEQQQLDVRMKALDQAIERCQRNNNPQYELARIDLMVRRLLEPRQYETRKVRGMLPTAAASHPKRRPLDAHESELHQQIQKCLKSILMNQNDDSKTTMTRKVITAEQWEFVGLREYQLGMCFRKLQPATAAAYFHNAYQHLPSTNIHRINAQFWLATIPSSSSSSSSIAIKRCPQDYVVGLYSTFAERFDDLLVHRLDYQTPSLLRAMVNETCSTINQQFATALDLGCGTGLSGMAFRDAIAGSLIGVDLSPAMIERARSRPNVYQQLIVGDIIQVLKEGKNKTFTNDDGVGDIGGGDEPDGVALYSLIFACDVFVYLGDLSDVFLYVYQALQPDGIFAFSTELLSDTSSTNPINKAHNDYVLQSCARFAHKKSYIQQLATTVGYQLLTDQVCTIRKNEGKDVTGLLVVLKK